jgi:hypothetical protein
MEEDREQTTWEAEADQRHLNWQCDHYHWGTDVHLGPAPTPHRHVPFQQEALDLEGDLLGFNPVRWTIEWAGPERRCRGIEVVAPDPVTVGRWVADPGHPAGTDEHVAARLRR